MKTIIAGFLALGMIVSGGMATVASAHAATNWNRVTVSGNEGG
jgi:hypothetical protein